MDAEDIVQEAYLRYQHAGAAPENPHAFLRKIVTNLCLDLLKSARNQREHYVGEWLPEPIPSDQIMDPVVKAENISMAFLVVLETLSPLERAVFILRSVFDYDYSEIARIIDKSETGCRQLYSRARKHVQEHRQRFAPSPEAHTRLVMQFAAAIEHGSISEFTSLLAQEVTLVSDGGGKVSAATRPLHGRDVVTRFLIGIGQRAQQAGVTYHLEVTSLNYEPAVVVREQGGAVIFAALFESSEQHITAVRIIRNPDKLRKIR